MKNEKPILGVQIPGLAVSLADVEFEDASEGKTVTTSHTIFPDATLHHPMEEEPFKMDSKFRKGMMDSFKESGLKVPIDFNHRSTGGFFEHPSKEDGAAAGWVTKLTSRGKQGLEAKIEWNEAGLEAIRSKTYQYLSPEFTLKQFDKATGERVEKPRLFAVALTNRPFLENQDTLAASDVPSPGQEEDDMGTQEQLDKLTAMMEAQQKRHAEEDTRRVEESTKLHGKIDLLVAKNDAAEVSLKLARDEQIKSAITLAQKDGRVTSENLEKIEKYAKMCGDPKEIQEFLDILPKKARPEQEGIANPGANREGEGAELTADEKTLYDRLEVTPEEVAKFDGIKGFLVGSGRVVMNDGTTQRVAKFLDQKN